MGLKLKIDFEALKKLSDKIKSFTNAGKNDLCKEISQELGVNLLRRTVLKTPVDTGNLRRNWKQSGHDIKNGYESIVFNQTEYAVYVEFGHRTRNKTGWVDGRYMLSNSVEEVDKMSKEIVEKHVKKALGDIFNDK